VNYGVTIYGPIEDTLQSRQKLLSVVATAFPIEYAQFQTLWQTMLNYPDFNSVNVVMRRDGDLVVHVYYSPVDVSEGADCAFHAKISPGGTYA
jgi:hypothetical protein